VSPETVALSLALACVLVTWRAYLRAIRRHWRHMRRWERIALALCALPLPGPTDELIAAAIMARVVRRARAQEPLSETT
jgi:hypothetical protein